MGGSIVTTLADFMQPRAVQPIAEELAKKQKEISIAEFF